MRYLITGGLGVVGSLLARQLLDAGNAVHIIDACEEPRNLWIKNDLQRVYGSRVFISIERLEDSSGLVVDLQHVDMIVHAAAHTGIPHSAADPNDDWVSNVDATRRLLEALRLCGRKIPTVIMSSVKPYRVHDLTVRSRGKRYVWTDSFDYTNSRETTGINESFPLEPDEPYAASKMAQSALAMAYARAFSLPVACLRFSNLYGPAPCHGPRHGWLTWFAISKALDRPIKVQGPGLQVRDMLYSTDINAALLAALSHIDETAGNVYNVGGGADRSVSVLEAAEMLGATHLWYAPGRVNEDPIFITDHSKFTKITGWTPTVSVEVGVDLVLNWARSHRAALEALYANL